ncbi:polysaccharide pyruvyl transferase family protein [Bacteroides rodentium]|uniref:polysaccharide pyruvyl transferase family protein n=1 Tax=Bacteroides rodentium TaxID=691816 RepID=UPI000472CE8E|nr:polysaccharide pyruvyl transferase family protein [Bacteroides rodentium]
MKINTLTTYDVYNYGASLQAYALQQYLMRLGHEVEIINYQPHYLTRKYDYKWVNPESKLSKYALTRAAYRVMKYLQRQTTLGRKRMFDIFNHQVLKETPVRYTSYKVLRNNPPQADLYVVGSDQIWNVFYETGRDPAFYLDFVTNGKKASYAASFSYVDIPQAEKKRIAGYLQTFDAVSVRESHGLQLLREMNIPGEWVLDPVFLLSVEEWKSLMTDYRKTEPYLLVYDFEGNDALKAFAQRYARQHGLKIYNINDTYPRLYADKNFSKAGPREFLSLIYHCDAFVSNSFHGTAFSIMFHKPVYVFNRHRHKVNSRMESLLDLFGLKGCIEPKSEQVFDWEAIEVIKKRNLDNSVNYLKQLVEQ